MANTYVVDGSHSFGSEEWRHAEYDEEPLRVDPRAAQEPCHETE